MSATSPPADPPVLQPPPSAVGPSVRRTSSTPSPVAVPELSVRTTPSEKVTAPAGATNEKRSSWARQSESPMMRRGPVSIA